MVDEDIAGVIVFDLESISIGGSFGVTAAWAGGNDGVGAVGVADSEGDGSPDGAVAGVMGFETVVVGWRGTGSTTRDGGYAGDEVVAGDIGGYDIDSAAAEVKAVIVGIAVITTGTVSRDEDAKITIGYGADGGERKDMAGSFNQVNGVVVVGVARDKDRSDGKLVGVENVDDGVAVRTDSDRVASVKVGGGNGVGGGGSDGLDFNPGSAGGGAGGVNSGSD